MSIGVEDQNNRCSDSQHVCELQEYVECLGVKCVLSIKSSQKRHDATDNANFPWFDPVHRSESNVLLVVTFNVICTSLPWPNGILSCPFLSSEIQEPSK
jgi:hypothetical protein